MYKALPGMRLCCMATGWSTPAAALSFLGLPECMHGIWAGLERLFSAGPIPLCGLVKHVRLGGLIHREGGALPEVH